MALNLEPDNVSVGVFGSDKVICERDAVERTDAIDNVDQRIPNLFYGIKWLTDAIVKERKVGVYF